MGWLNRDQEANRLLESYGSDMPAILGVVERQFAVLTARAQVLLALCGIVISTTGFSGRIVAGTNRLAQVLIVSGVAFVLLSACVVVWGVLHLRWLTMQAGDTPHDWVLASITYRDRKTQSYRIAILLMLIGLTLYCGAIAVMLLNPHEGGLPAR